jgi:hypothetical protein
MRTGTTNKRTQYQPVLPPLHQISFSNFSSSHHASCLLDELQILAYSEQSERSKQSTNTRA